MCPSNSVEVFAPFDRARIGAAATADADSVQHALKTTYGLYRNRDAWLPLAERIRILEKAQELLRPPAETLVREAAREGGKPLVDSRVEIARAIDSLRI
jgi:acyl-CoA reductase-like NAD-dependent aldehyde dehydrogenase